MHHFTTLVAVSLLAAFPTHAADPQAGEVTRAAVTTFARACLGQALDQSRVDGWLMQNGFNRARAEAAEQLAMGNPGTVWLNGTSGSPFAVITRSSGIRCQVMAPNADPEEAAALFRGTINALARPDGLQVRKDTDGTVDLGGQPGRRVEFRVGPRPLEKGGYTLTLSATPPRPGRVALLITAAYAPPEASPN